MALDISRQICKFKYYYIFITAASLFPNAHVCLLSQNV